MQRTLLNSAALMLATLAGCNQGTPGGPGTTDANVEQATIGQTDNTFNLSVPMMSSTLQQGASCRSLWESSGPRTLIRMSR